ncbi:MAG: DegT/DnrJ/EryC1/StrS family aminotransferase [Candidatus Omnitrophota bacterium]
MSLVRNKIRLARSIVGIKEVQALRRIIMDDGYLGMGREVHLFEEDLKGFLSGKGDVVCVNSGTAALHLAVMAIVKPGDEVLVPSFTFVASFQAIKAAGAVPVACDIDPETLLLDLKDAVRRITRRTKVVMPVHYAGAVGDLKAVYSFAREHKLRVVEDAAHAFGTTYQNKKIGSFGDIACFSFDGIKNITSAEGGAVVTADKKVLEFVKDARLLGVHQDTEKRFSGQRSWEFEVYHQGYRYHMSNLFAAIGRTQLKKFHGFARARQMLSSRYQKELKGIQGLGLIPMDIKTIVPHIFPVFVKNNRRDALRAFLAERGIESGIHYYPSHRLKFFARSGVKCPHADAAYAMVLSLPLHPGLSGVEQGVVIKTIKEFFSHE